MCIGLIPALAALGFVMTPRNCPVLFDETSCSCNDCASGCGNTHTEICRPATPCDMLGCLKINQINWTVVCPESECQIREATTLACKGFDTTRTCPVKSATRILSSSAVPCEFRGKPAYLKDEKEYCGKRYVLLGISCVGDIAVELAPISCQCGYIYTICRFAVIK